MRVILQRVKEASVEVGNQITGNINEGLLIFLGVEHEDTQDDIDWLVRKITQLRIFADENDKMNLSLIDVGAEALVVSQFTLHASTKKGNRPSFTKSASPEVAEELYEQFVERLKLKLGQVHTGRFGTDMKVSLVNDGPLTFILDSKEKY